MLIECHMDATPSFLLLQKPPNLEHSLVLNFLVGTHNEPTHVPFMLVERNIDCQSFFLVVAETAKLRTLLIA